ncbi:hypothetical protein HPB51_002273 [Rhipicephalus microplus]|uniref:Uncharacterized protein n=1 Tax=Rhipicephalus microplus TaxID=6941 RepID=A0A9J6DY21_RHIMP|nr:hypothetical protein HPB51_002273 [Rhipicephalus microplus]
MSGCLNVPPGTIDSLEGAAQVTKQKTLTDDSEVPTQAVAPVVLGSQLSVERQSEQSSADTAHAAEVKRIEAGTTQPPMESKVQSLRKEAIEEFHFKIASVLTATAAAPTPAAPSAAARLPILTFDKRFVPDTSITTREKVEENVNRVGGSHERGEIYQFETCGSSGVRKSTSDDDVEVKLKQGSSSEVRTVYAVPETRPLVAYCHQDKGRRSTGVMSPASPIETIPAARTSDEQSAMSTLVLSKEHNVDPNRPRLRVRPIVASFGQGCGSPSRPLSRASSPNFSPSATSPVSLSQPFSQELITKSKPSYRAILASASPDPDNGLKVVEPLISPKNGHVLGEFNFQTLTKCYEWASFTKRYEWQCFAYESSACPSWKLSSFRSLADSVEQSRSTTSTPALSPYSLEQDEVLTGDHELLSPAPKSVTNLNNTKESLIKTAKGVLANEGNETEVADLSNSIKPPPSRESSTKVAATGRTTKGVAPAANAASGEHVMAYPETEKLKASKNLDRRTVAEGEAKLAKIFFQKDMGTASVDIALQHHRKNVKSIIMFAGSEGEAKLAKVFPAVAKEQKKTKIK